MSALAPHRRFVDAAVLRVLFILGGFGKTPLFNVEERRANGVGMAPPPPSACRAMKKVVEAVPTAMCRDATGKNVLEPMPPRVERQDRIGCHEYKQRLNGLFASKK